jgi:hypothetical protein
VTLRLATGANLRALGAAAALGAKRESMAGWASSTARAVCVDKREYRRVERGGRRGEVGLRCGGVAVVV